MLWPKPSQGEQPQTQSWFGFVTPLKGPSIRSILVRYCLGLWEDVFKPDKNKIKKPFVLQGERNFGERKLWRRQVKSCCNWSRRTLLFLKVTLIFSLSKFFYFILLIWFLKKIGLEKQNQRWLFVGRARK